MPTSCSGTICLAKIGARRRLHQSAGKLVEGNEAIERKSLASCIPTLAADWLLEAGLNGLPISVLRRIFVQARLASQQL
jgi:hypothetical protein